MHPMSDKADEIWKKNLRFKAYLMDDDYRCRSPLISILMALWSQMLTYFGDSIRTESIYDDSFPFEVRHFLAYWIEDVPWHDVNTENLEHLSFASEICSNLIKRISARGNELVQESNNELLVPYAKRLLATSKSFENTYRNNPMALVKKVQIVLEYEKSLLRSKGVNFTSEKVYTSSISSPVTASNETCLRGASVLTDSRFFSVENGTKDMANALKVLQQKQEAFVINYSQVSKFATHYKLESVSEKLTSLMLNMNSMEANSALATESLTPSSLLNENISEHELKKAHSKYLDAIDKLKVSASHILQESHNLASKFSDTLETISQLYAEHVNEKLLHWKLRERSFKPKPVKYSENLLLHLKASCDSLIELILMNKNQIKILESLLLQIPLPTSASAGMSLLYQVHNYLHSLLNRIVCETFVVCEQPPQVLKTNTRFTSCVSCISASKLGIHLSHIQVYVSIINEAEAKEIVDTGSPVPSLKSSSGQILNNIGVLQLNEDGILCAKFKNMQLKKIKRQEKKGSETIADEKCCLLYQCEFKVGGGDYTFNTWTFSLPVVVIVHGSQEQNAVASILWDNAFSELNREPFRVCQEVRWRQFKVVLYEYFLSTVGGKTLSDDDLHYLACKLFGVERSMAASFDDSILTFHTLTKDHMKGRSFTFWQWFFHICILLKEAIKPHWHDCTILGFISKSCAQALLLSCPLNTFLLRFSDSTLGALTIAWVDKFSDSCDKKAVWNLKPFTVRDFNIRPLGDRIKDLTQLKFLYPDIPKYEAFSKYFSRSENEDTKSIDGYVGTILVTTTPLLKSNEDWLSSSSFPLCPDMTDGNIDVIQALELDPSSWNHQRSSFNNVSLGDFNDSPSFECSNNASSKESFENFDI